MSGMTPSERSGARVLALVLAIGTLTDLYRARFPRPVASSAIATDAPAAGTAGARVPDPRAATPPAAVLTRTLDLDSAGVADLDALPGIGPVLARRIVEHRRLHGRFRHVDELLLVPGIGPRLVERLRPFLREPSQ